MAKQKTILIVEDDEDSRLALCTIIESLGYKQVNFNSAMSALAGVKDVAVDLALVDIMMPEMNGYQLLQKLREDPKFKDLPVIFVTAKDEDSEVLEGYKFGADYYIPKPYTAKQVEYGLRLFLNK